MQAVYEAAAERIFRCGDVRIKVCKTQTSYYAKRMFAALSDGPRKGTVRLTFGLRREMSDPRIAARANPAPGRWTYHVDLRSAEELDSQIDEWLAEAYMVSGMGIVP